MSTSKLLTLLQCPHLCKISTGERERERDGEGGLGMKRGDDKCMMFVARHYSGSSVDPTLLDKLEEVLPGYRKPARLYDFRYVL